MRPPRASSGPFRPSCRRPCGIGPSLADRSRRRPDRADSPPGGYLSRKMLQGGTTMTTSTAAPESTVQFPVPADLDGFWMFDQVHCPRPLSPLTREILLAALTEGFCSALLEVGYPLGIVMRVVNAYGYIALLPHLSSDGTPLSLPAWDDAASAASITGLGER